MNWFFENEKGLDWNFGVLLDAAKIVLDVYKVVIFDFDWCVVLVPYLIHTSFILILGSVSLVSNYYF